LATANQQQQQGGENFNDDYEVMHQVGPTRQQMPVAQPLFPSSILSIVPQLIEMFDDVQVCFFKDTLCLHKAYNLI
jgi:hypothetical protein